MYTFFGYGLWLVFLKETGELIGRVGIENREIDNTTKQEIGYLIGKDYQEQGYAYEACEATIEYARTMLNLDELFACIHRDNFKSIAFLEKLGFRIYARDIGDMNLYRLEI
jgi:RimJ/RimL family protein N-acetyltransferase